MGVFYGMELLLKIAPQVGEQNIKAGYKSQFVSSNYTLVWTEITGGSFKLLAFPLLRKVDFVVFLCIRSFNKFKVLL